eukprot:514919-Pleurochrysis_carterae.AAC.4
MGYCCVCRAVVQSGCTAVLCARLGGFDGDLRGTMGAVAQQQHLGEHNALVASGWQHPHPESAMLEKTSERARRERLVQAENKAGETSQ